MKIKLSILSSIILLCIAIGCKKNKNNEESPAAGNTFLHVYGTKIVDEKNSPVKLQGVAFGNWVWDAPEISFTHHNETDYQRVKDMGMNVVRFYMKYQAFENDTNPYQYKQSGWDWIDQNIAWAKKHGIYLILNMHIPQGGYQSQGTGDDLWNSTENQNRLAALWKAIAEKYKDEKQVIGYGPVNEPVPVSNISQWQQLAQRLANEIRTVDKNHILFVEQAIYVKGQPETADHNFPIITDSNTAYEFHIYNPINYTHQLFTWANQGDGGKYPDDNIASYTNGTWYTAIFNNPAINPGNNEWKYYEGVKYKITDPKIKIGLPALVGANVAGRVYFDSIVIKEYDAAGLYTKDILAMNLSNTDGWSFWSSNNSGSSGLSNQTGVADNNSIFIEGSTDDCNTSNYNKGFIPKQGFSYQINGWMKGENVAANAACRLRIDFITTNDPIYGRNKQYLAASVKRFVDWGKLKNVPIYMGEFGAGAPCFENNKGGLQWVTDMLDIAKENGIYFTYHAYHEDSFGLYFGFNALPDPANSNQPLIDLFKQKLK